MNRTKLIALLAGLALSSLAYADTKISALPAGGALAGTEPIPAVQGGATVKTTPAAIDTYVESQITSADVISKWSGTCDITTFLRADGNCAASTTTPAGANTQIQYNASGSFGASTKLTWVDGSTRLNISTGSTAGNLQTEDNASGAAGTILVRPGSSSGANQAAGATVRGGVPGPTGNGGSLSLQLLGSPGGATSGNAGGVLINAGIPTDGVGGDVSITASNGVGTNRSGGSIFLATGSATGSGTAGEVKLNNTTLFASGTLTATITTGCSTTPTVSFSYARVYNTVTLQMTQSNLTCTSNTTTHTTTDAFIPAALRPAREQTFFGVPVVNNANSLIGCMSISTGGVVIWELNQTTGGSTLCQNNGYTASGNRGLVGTGSQGGTYIFTYLLN